MFIVLIKSTNINLHNYEIKYLLAHFSWEVKVHLWQVKLNASGWAALRVICPRAVWERLESVIVCPPQLVRQWQSVCVSRCLQLALCLLQRYDESNNIGVVHVHVTRARSLVSNFESCSYSNLCVYWGRVPVGVAPLVCFCCWTREIISPPPSLLARGGCNKWRRARVIRLMC